MKMQMKTLKFMSEKGWSKKLSNKNVSLLNEAIKSIEAIISKSKKPVRDVSSCYWNCVALKDAFNSEKRRLEIELENYKNSSIKDEPLQETKKTPSKDKRTDSLEKQQTEPPLIENGSPIIITTPTSESLRHCRIHCPSYHCLWKN